MVYKIKGDGDLFFYNEYDKCIFGITKIGYWMKWEFDIRQVLIYELDSYGSETIWDYNGNKITIRDGNDI